MIGMRSFSILFVLLSTLAASAETRKWTSADGQFTVDAELVELKADAIVLRKGDGKTVSVPRASLSDADRQFLKDLPETASERVLKFLLVEKEMRPLERKRIEKRLKELRADLVAGAKDATNPVLGQAAVAKKAKLLLKQLELRQRELENAKFLMPRLSPEDLVLGQIGMLDDDLIASHCRLPNKDLAAFSMLHEELQYETRLPGRPPVWVRGVVSRPSSLHVRGPFVAKFKLAEEKDQAGPNNVLLHSTTFEVVAYEKIGNVAHFILAPYDAAEVKQWLAKQAK